MGALDDQVDASADDAFERECNDEVVISGGDVLVQSHASADLRDDGGLRFHSSSFPTQGSTITAAYIEVYSTGSGWDSPNCDIYAQDTAAPPTFEVALKNITNRTKTDAVVPWVADALGLGWVQSPSLVAVIQELVNDYSPSAIVLILQSRSDLFKRFEFYGWEYSDHSYAAKLHLEWTEGGVAPDPDIYRGQPIESRPYSYPAMSREGLERRQAESRKQRGLPWTQFTSGV